MNQVSRIAGSISLLEAAEKTWDSIIIGAGVAGSATAIFAAKRGLNVLLVEAKDFPREKVCGGCLNRRAMATLRILGLDDLVRSAGAIELSELHVRVRKVDVVWPIPCMQSIRRSTLDTLLVQKAISHGVAFLPSTKAYLGDFPADAKALGISDVGSFKVELACSKVSDARANGISSGCVASAKSVVVAAGLTRSALRGSDQWPSNTQKDSRIGVQTIVDLFELVEHVPELGRAIQSDPGRLHMFSSQAGYVGVCLTDQRMVDIAAAVDPSRVQQDRCVYPVVAQILSDCGFRIEGGLDHYQWLATPLLTRRSDEVAKPGVFLAGDSLGYVEPFTGEGMSWALDNAERLAPLLARIVESPSERIFAQQDWVRYVDHQRRFRQRVCRWVARQSRYPQRSQWFLRFCQWFPMFRNRLLREAIL